MENKLPFFFSWFSNTLNLGYSFLGRRKIRLISQSIILVILFFLPASSIAQNFQLEWGKDLPASFSNTRGFHIDRDSSGNIYVAGRFSNNQDFDPSANVATLVHSPNFDNAFIAKYDPDGNYLWAYEYTKHPDSTNATPLIEGMSVNSAGEVYVTGRFNNTIDFDVLGGVNDTSYLTTTSSWDCLLYTSPSPRDA